MIWENAITVRTTTLNRKQKGNATIHYSTAAKEFSNKSQEASLATSVKLRLEVYHLSIVTRRKRNTREEIKELNVRMPKLLHEGPRPVPYHTIQDMLRANAMIEGEDDAAPKKKIAQHLSISLTKLPLKVSTGSSVKYVRNGTTSIV